jgi:hypothetical protein
MPGDNLGVMGRKCKVQPVLKNWEELKHEEAQLVRQAVFYDSAAFSGKMKWEERDKKIKEEIEPKLNLVRHQLSTIGRKF